MTNTILRLSICISCISCILMLGMVSSCKSSVSNTTLQNNGVTRQPEDSAVVIDSLLVPMSLDDLINNSECIVLGKVSYILPSLKGTDGPDVPIIFTDVIIDVEQYLLSDITAQSIAIRTIGGRVGHEVVIAEDQPIFTIGEEVLVFLFQPTAYQLTPVPDTFSSSSYFKVTGSLQGKWEVKDGMVIDSKNQGFSVSEIVNQITALRNTA